MATIFKTYNEITVAVGAATNISTIAFQKLTIEQRVFLVNRHLGVVNSRLYEALDEKQVVSISSKKIQNKFSHTFAHIKEATAMFKEISKLLNSTLFGIYNTKTRYFMLLETFKSFMTHADKSHLVSTILNNATAESTSASVTVASIGNSAISVSAAEIKAILDSFTKTIYIKLKSPDLTVTVESLLLSLLDVKFEKEASVILNNFNNISDTITSLGGNLVVESFISVDNYNPGGGLIFSTGNGKKSEIRLYNDGVNILTADDHLVEVDISKYDSGALRIYFGGTNIYNATPSRGIISLSSLSPGSSKHTSLVIQSDDFKGTIGNISIRKITS